MYSFKVTFIECLVFNKHLPRQKLIWKKEFIEPYAGQEKEQALEDAALTTNCRPRWRKRQVHRPGMDRYFHTEQVGDDEVGLDLGQVPSAEGIDASSSDWL